MRKRLIVIITGIFLLVSVWVGTASAQGVPGYPVPGYPIETEVPTKPPENTPPPSTPDPTQPPQPNPTEAPPTWVPPQPTPTETPENTPKVCHFPEARPIFSVIAEQYGVPFEEVIDLFCESQMNIGEILIYLQGLYQPEDGPGPRPGFAMSFPGPDGQRWNLFWRVFNLIDFHGMTRWALPN
jgi:hypothetical protein